MDSEENPEQAGAQSVERAAALLRLVAAHGVGGARLLDLAAASGVARPTVHRILKRLCAERLLTQDASNKRYLLGALLYELGLAAPSPIRRIDRMRPLLQSLAAVTEDTAYLVMRSGDEAVCLHLEEGSYPIRARTFEIGARRPLGMGAAGLALLAALPAADAQACLERAREGLLRHDLSEAEVLQRVARARVNGAISQGTITAGVTGLAVVVPPQAGTPYLAVSVAAIAQRMPTARLSTLYKQLAATARRIAAIEAAGG